MNIAYLWVAIGGALGSMSRYWLNGIISNYAAKVTLGAFALGTFPLGTMVINVTGSFLIGIFSALTVPEGRMDSQSRMVAIQLLMIGVCGGYTTFSSFSLQTLSLMRDGEWSYAGVNIILSVVLCLVAVWLGFLLGSMFTSIKGN